MSEDYIKSIEEENVRLRDLAASTQVQNDLVIEKLNEVKEFINSNSIMKPETTLRSLNTDRSGQIFMTNNKNINIYYEELSKIETYFEKIKKIVDINS